MAFGAFLGGDEGILVNWPSCAVKLIHRAEGERHLTHTHTHTRREGDSANTQVRHSCCAHFLEKIMEWSFFFTTDNFQISAGQMCYSSQWVRDRLSQGMTGNWAPSLNFPILSTSWESCSFSFMLRQVTLTGRNVELTFFLFAQA